MGEAPHPPRIGDGKPFEIDASYLEGRKWLRINGTDQPYDPAGDCYEHVLATAFRWARQCDRAQLMSGLSPSRFTRVTYQLSSALWRSCRDQKELAFASVEPLNDWDAGFAAEIPHLPRYDKPITDLLTEEGASPRLRHPSPSRADGEGPEREIDLGAHITATGPSPSALDGEGCRRRGEVPWPPRGSAIEFPSCTFVKTLLYSQ